MSGPFHHSTKAKTRPTVKTTATISSIRTIHLRRRFALLRALLAAQRNREAPRDARGPAGDREAGYDLRRSRIIGRQAAPRLGCPQYMTIAVVQCVDAERPAAACVLA